ncbi:hydrolase TatD [Endomicrobiia bacterium]|uniref:TatD family hydrolase n=1 Tax=Endomicrobium trichonymphae TaxID=1408204 RepID=UPI000864A808|nr:TatD family hydrolase [Candidatus Endomicrobium trichonymphae]GHT05716.1 hydrolase TatD [Endomicrobiia bacterium]BAV58904.1 TatD-related deoxyribonuclease [Candidatus Endomicrobium trichonymphae]GHT11556.1 hydrolase TatD [Endomicrobiia bacterium]GHT21232.1 hydrolase TatD [Endomicrobiia bacterium]GHT27559.1 hydrolase TatD [Endomicrobiia bacterium]
MIIDTHAHMSDSRFDNDREIVIQKAFDCGIEKIFEIACEMRYWDRALELSKRDNIFLSVGVHPIETTKATREDYYKLQVLIQDKKCIAIGEIGLDYHYDSSLQNTNTQKESFFKQIDIAVKYNKAVIIHCRDAYDEMIDFFKKYKNVPKGVIHCFSGTPKQAKMFIEMGFLLGINGPVTYKKSDNLKQVVFETDLNKLLVETDCPYLAPQKYRGQRNEPSYIAETLKEIAAIKNILINEVVQITTQNALKLFGI